MLSLLVDFETAVDALETALADPQASTETLVDLGNQVVSEMSQVSDADDFASFLLESDVEDSIAGAKSAVEATQLALQSLADLSAIGPANVSGADSLSLQEAELAWEYWDGRRWKALTISGNEDKTHFRVTEPPPLGVFDDLIQVKKFHQLQ